MHKELENVKRLNEDWQKVALNKCEVMHAIFAEWKETQDLTKNVTFAPVGYVTEDESQIHLGRGVWIRYDTYLFAINGIKFNTRKRFFRQMSVAVFGYDLLAKSTITGKGSNRNGGSKELEMRLDPKKLGAIKDIYTHFCVQNLNMDYNEADSEAGEANQSIRKKISQLKEIKTKPKKQGRPLLGENATVIRSDEGIEDDEVGNVNEPNGNLQDMDGENDEVVEENNEDDQVQIDETASNNNFMDIDDIEDNLPVTTIELCKNDPLDTKRDDSENSGEYDSDKSM